MADHTKAKLKAQKKFKEFTENADALSVDQLKQKITAYRFHQAETERSLEENESVRELKDTLKTLTGPYSDTLKAIKIKTDYMIALIDEKGGDISGTANG